MGKGEAMLEILDQSTARRARHRTPRHDQINEPKGKEGPRYADSASNTKPKKTKSQTTN